MNSPNHPNESKRTEWMELAQARASAYTLLSSIWGIEVSADFYQQLRTASFPSLPGLPELDRAYRRLEEALVNNSPGRLAELRADFARLCLGSDPREGADPYESVHRNKEGLLMQDEWEAVLRLYQSLGLQRAEGTHESEDHLALELECMALLCTRQASALEEGNLPEAAWWLEQQAVMLDQHLLLWVPSFAARVRKLGRTDFYIAFADLTEAYLEADRTILGELQAGE